MRTTFKAALLGGAGLATILTLAATPAAAQDACLGTAEALNLSADQLADIGERLFRSANHALWFSHQQHLR